MLLPGEIDDDAVFALAAVREIVQRCAPWCRLYCSPYVLYCGRDVLGIALYDERVIAIAVGYRVQDCVRTAHHEVWHAAEQRMSVETIDCVQSVAGRGREWPGEYLSSDTERRARLYESWASARDEGWSPPCFEGVPFHEANRIFEDLYSGKFARLVAAADAPRPPPRPGIFDRARRALLARRWMGREAARPAPTREPRQG